MHYARHSRSRRCKSYLQRAFLSARREGELIFLAGGQMQNS